MRGLKFLILGLAIAAGVGAIALVRSELSKARNASDPAPRVVEVVEPDKTQVLVAATDLGRGRAIGADDVVWREWPSDLLSESFITRDADPEAIQKMRGFLVKANLVEGEPVLQGKLINIKRPGVVSAMVRPGMRAVAIEISPEQGAGGFVLPGDFVDVILTRDVQVEVRSVNGSYRDRTMLITNTLLRSVKVLAIDFTFDAGDEASLSTKRTATLEVTPDMAELLALAERAGRVTLALRGLAELVADDGTLVDEPTPEMASTAAEIGAGGSLPDQAEYAKSPETADAAPTPASGGSVLIIRGSAQATANVK